jgi:perosamine synthetase
VFVDVDADSWCISPESFAAAVTPRTKAVIPVDLYGNMPDMDAIVEVAGKHGVAVIEDAAQAHGSEYKGRKAGSFGLASAFSFHGSKTLTTGEGGMLVMDDEKVWQRCLFLRDHGRSPGDVQFYNTEVAYKYKMSALQAALGLAQLERIEELVRRKREIFGWYREGFEAVEGIVLNSEAEGVKSTYWMVTAVLDGSLGVTGADLMKALDGRGIDTRPFFRPLSSLPAYAHMGVAEECRKRNPNAYGIAPRGLNLPSGFNLTREKVAHVCARVREALARS